MADTGRLAAYLGLGKGFDIRVSTIPTSRTVPASTASGLSVASRITSTGFPRLGASSWIPPLSVRRVVPGPRKIPARPPCTSLSETVTVPERMAI